MNNLNPSLPCPHCHAPIQGGLVKGLAAVKECPSCHKKVKFKKPPVGEYFKALQCLIRPDKKDETVPILLPVLFQSDSR